MTTFESQQNQLIEQCLVMKLTLLSLVLILNSLNPLSAQETTNKATVSSSIGDNGAGKIVVEAHGEIPTPPTFYSSAIENKVTIRANQIDFEADVSVKFHQGQDQVVRLWTRGVAEVISVTGESVSEWAIRWDSEKKRYLDVTLKAPEELGSGHQFVIKMREPVRELPSSPQITNFAPADSAMTGFSQTLTLNYAAGVEGRIVKVSAFVPLESKDDVPVTYHAKQGGQFVLRLNRSGREKGPVELSDFRIQGVLNDDGESASFQMQGVATVSEPGASVKILWGQAALTAIPESEHFRVSLGSVGKGTSSYEMTFEETGQWPFELDFTARVMPDKEWRKMLFSVAGGAVAPATLEGFPGHLEFRDDSSVVLAREEKVEGARYAGFLPANGDFHLFWKEARSTGEGKLFFSSTGLVEGFVSAGLLRQDHQIDYKILQGELDVFELMLEGEGEVLGVEGSNVVGWKVEAGAPRRLIVKMSQPVADVAQLRIRTQQSLDAFPVDVSAMSLKPVGAVRHSGYIRVSNQGSVRIEPSGLNGLTQLSPDQHPAKPIEAKQVFLYRFPSSDYEFDFLADRVQPEITVSELLLYEVGDTDRSIRADLELDIREAAIREWEIGIPGDYSIVSLTGASVSDYISTSADNDEIRSVKIIFSDDVIGRQLVQLHLEQNVSAEAGEWVLPSLRYPGIESVRGDVGVVGAPGIRVVSADTENLAEKPLSYFPKQVANLQQAFRIREPGWSATMNLEMLAKSVQADVFHLYSLSEGTSFGSVLINFFVTGAPLSEFRLAIPDGVENVSVEGGNVRSFRADEGVLTVSLHQAVIGAYTLLVTFEEKLDVVGGELRPGRFAPLGVEGERGFLQIVSPHQVHLDVKEESEGLLPLDPLELPAEFQLLTAAPSLGVWQYTSRPFELHAGVDWHEAGVTATQVVEFSEVKSRVSRDGELVSDVIYDVKSRGLRALRLQLPDSTRLWSVTVAGESVTARQSKEFTIIPLPGEVDSNQSVEVKLRLGRPAIEGANPMVTLPKVDAPVLKTEWHIVGESGVNLIPTGGTVSPPLSLLPPLGVVQLSEVCGLIAIIALLVLFGAWFGRRGSAWVLLGISFSLIAVLWLVLASVDFLQTKVGISPIKISLPNVASGELLEVAVRNSGFWQTYLTLPGVVACLVGVVVIVWKLVFRSRYRVAGHVMSGAGLFALGLLLQRNTAGWFCVILAVLLVLFLVIPQIRGGWASLRKHREKKKALKAKSVQDAGAAGGAATLIAMGLFLGGGESLFATEGVPNGFSTADSITQSWEIKNQTNRLYGSGSITFSGDPGEQFLLLREAAVLTGFKGEGLRVGRQDVEGLGLCYVVTIPSAEPSDQIQAVADPTVGVPVSRSFEATFSFEMECKNPLAGFSLPTGPSSVQEVVATYDRGGWVFRSPAAVKVESLPSGGKEVSSSRLILAAHQNPKIHLEPAKRDPAGEETQFFVETKSLYLPSPGVVDGRHSFEVRVSQGQVGSLRIGIPSGNTVSEVTGPIGSWQFDADQRWLDLSIEPFQSGTFRFDVMTQSSLTGLPVEIPLRSLLVENAEGQIGLMALAFGPDTQPEQVKTDTLSQVAAGDFPADLIDTEKHSLYRVYRYGAEGGELSLLVAPVAPEVRVTSQQILSLGDERVVLNVNFAADITRAGLFQLGFELPAGYEVESLTGTALHHWSEMSEDETQRVVMYLNGKTMGRQEFSLTLVSTSPNEEGEWTIPEFSIAEASRQTGELVVKPATGIRLQTLSRENVSELDPRTLGEGSNGSLAFKLLQKDWSLGLDLERLDPWITGEVLHEVTLREGQTKTALVGKFAVENASIQSLLVTLPLLGEEEARSVVATGDAISDLVRVSPDSDQWTLFFKRRVIGDVDFRIEYEKRGDRADDLEVVSIPRFPEARQISRFVAVRSGGRLEVSRPDLPQGWQATDWSSVPQELREAAQRSSPTLSLRVIEPSESLSLEVARHSIAEALKLRVAAGELTTVLSPLGDELTAVDLTMEVVQRSSLSVTLPPGGKLFSVFVNGESVHSVKQDGSWRFYILPGENDKTADVRFVYSITGREIRRVGLLSPELNVPLENISWNVVAPEGFSLSGHSGNLELTKEQGWRSYDRETYLLKSKGEREQQARKAEELLEKANDLLQAGEQSKASWAFNSVANQYGLDAASNEDARVQLENLQMQQAVVGLNTRRQRLFLNRPGELPDQAQAAQMEAGISGNRILNDGDVNFRPQELGQLLMGNTTEDNAALQRIATKLVAHQRTTLPAPQTISITLPEEGSVYTFQRTVQVAENASLKLELSFDRESETDAWRIAATILLLGLIGVFIGIRKRK